jgi:transcriptional regulator with XRE-family HTH domain
MRKKRTPRVRNVDIVIGWRIRETRIARGWNQSKISTMVGVSSQQFQKYESGQDRISASRLFLIADALRVSIDVLFGDIPLKIVKAPRVRWPKSDAPWTRETMQLFRYALQVSPTRRRALLDMARRVGS